MTEWSAVLTHIQQLYRTLRQSLTKSSFTASTKEKDTNISPECVSRVVKSHQEHSLLGFFFCIVNVGLIKISTSSLGDNKHLNSAVTKSNTPLASQWEPVIKG